MAKKSLVKSAAILAAAGIIVKIMGAFFRIPLANLIGDVGMGYYFPAYSIYGFLLVFATAGIPVAISKMVSERCAVGQFREADRVHKLSRNLMLLIGIIGFAILLFFSDFIATNISHLPEAALAMKATAPALLLIPIMSSYRGYFQGMQEMTPTAISEVAEQMCRVICGLALAVLLMRDTYSFLGESVEERGAAGGCFGASAGAAGGLIVMVTIYLLSRKKIKKRIASDKTTERESSREIYKKIATIAIPITIGAATMPLVNLLDSAIVASRLMAAGFSKIEAAGLFGQMTGFAAPIVQFPLVLVQSIAIGLVPMVSAANRLGNRKELHHNIALGLRMATIISIPAALGLFLLAEPIMIMLYPAQEASAVNAAICLQILAIGFIFLALISVMTGALQGVGKQGIPVINLAIGIVVKFIITWVLTAIPEINVNGAAIGTVTAYVVAATLDYLALRKYSGVRLSAGLTIIKPLISALVMSIFVIIAYKGVFALLGSNGTAVVVSIGVGVIVYGLMVLRTKAIRREEMMSLSIGRKLAAVCDKLRLW